MHEFAKTFGIKSASIITCCLRFISVTCKPNPVWKAWKVRKIKSSFSGFPGFYSLGQKIVELGSRFREIETSGNV